jgi:hypothetical protein
MCFSHPKPPPAPTPPPQSGDPSKQVIYMRNQWLDGLGINAESAGRNSLRIDLGSPTPHRPVYTGGGLPPSTLGIGGGQPPGPGNGGGHGGGFGFFGGGGGGDRVRGLMF